MVFESESTFLGEVGGKISMSTTGTTTGVPAVSPRLGLAADKYKLPNWSSSSRRTGVVFSRTPFKVKFQLPLAVH